jgi:hypothetical protein
MVDRDDEIVLRADLPGLDEKDIEVRVHDHTLTIQGERKEEKEEKKEDYYFSERSYGAFTRTLPLPAGVEADKVKATFKKGVLEVHLPKAKEAKGKKIEVKASAYSPSSRLSAGTCLDSAFTASRSVMMPTSAPRSTTSKLPTCRSSINAAACVTGISDAVVTGLVVMAFLT